LEYIWNQERIVIVVLSSFSAQRLPSNYLHITVLTLACWLNATGGIQGASEFADWAISSPKTISQNQLSEYRLESYHLYHGHDVQHAAK